jgi:hypothetical protein
MSEAMDSESWRGVKRQLEEWQEHTATKMLMKDLQAEVDRRQNEILLTPVRSTEAVYEQEFNKGVIFGLLKLPQLVESLLETADYEIGLLKEKESDNE